MDGGSWWLDQGCEVNANLGFLFGEQRGRSKAEVGVPIGPVLPNRAVEV